MSITAFPVLARILSDRGLQRTQMGIIALTCAAINDVTAWCLLAFVVGVTQATPGAAAQTVILTALYVVLMLTVGRRIMTSAVAKFDASPRMGERSLALVLVAVLLSAVATEFIGIHAIFGAFLLGAIIPHESVIAKHVTDRLQDIVRVMFLPAFFAFTGLRTRDRPGATRLATGSCAAIIVPWPRPASSAAPCSQRGRRPRLARQRGARHPDEHARADGADRPQHRPRPGRDLTTAVRHDGDHGARHDVDDVADSHGAASQAAMDLVIW